MRLSRFVVPYTAATVLAALAGAQTPYNQLPSRIIGQAILQRTTLTAVAPNLAEGRELFSPQSVALDTSASPNILYVADTGNNRILAWKNAASAGNGAFADMVIGQPDFFSTTFQGPSPSSTTNYGLNQPVAIAIDSTGNLYIADAGNNRILRFPKPFSQGSGIQPPDLVIGQTSLNSNVANQGQSAPSASTVFLAAGSSVYRSGLAFDSQGNLWFSDAGNNRVLRYPASVLGSSAANGPSADTVIGQSDFTSNSLPANPTQQMKTFVAQPAFLAFDPSGRLYVADNFLRVLVFQNPLTTGEPAVRILGVVPGATAVSAKTLGASQNPPEGIFFVGSNPWVVDTPTSRIVGYAPFEQWAPESQSFSPAAIAVLGQADFVSSKVNRGNPQPSNNSLAVPVGAAFNGTNLYVADAGNHRVLAFPISGTAFTSASVVLGQLDFKYNAVNLIEGREFNFSFNGGIAVDTASNPPRLYVADAGNNRVLAFSDIRKAAAGLSADFVIGQPDLRTSVPNFPSGTSPSDTSLSLPTAVAVDSTGSLWVADTGNGRVLRFPSPFAQGSTTLEAANLVIGQLNFTQTLTGVSAQTMGAPTGIAFTKEGGLVVSDARYNRVLYFQKQSGGFVNGQSATSVIGQATFSSSSANDPASGSGGLNSPRGVAVDSSDTLYVADSSNGRVAMFTNVASIGNGAPANLSLGNLYNVEGVVINPATQEIWVANTSGNNLYRYQSYGSILQGNTTPTMNIPSPGPLAVTLDAHGNPVVAEGAANRVSFYYPVMYPRHAANYFVRFAPGMLATLFPAAGTQFGDTKEQASSLPIPTTLGDVQVIVNGVASPIFYASSSQINFQVPMKTPVGLQEVQVMRVSTQEVLSDSFVSFAATAPGLFTVDGSGNNQVSAINAADNTPNSVTNPVKAGQYISLFATGQGVVPGAPPDGQLPNGTINTPSLPQVFPNLVPGQVQFSGLAPCCVGLWQINVQVPSNAAPRADQILVQYQGNNSANDGSGQQKIDSNGIQHSVVTTIYVKQ